MKNRMQETSARVHCFNIDFEEKPQEKQSAGDQSQSALMLLEFQYKAKEKLSAGDQGQSAFIVLPEFY